MGFSPPHVICVHIYAYGFFILKCGIIKILVTFMMIWNACCHFLLSKIHGIF